jgi:hypothetical protein
MTLGERCDEILRLIDETLCDIAAADDPDGADSFAVSSPVGARRERGPMFIEHVARFGVAERESAPSIVGAA